MLVAVTTASICDVGLEECFCVQELCTLPNELLVIRKTNSAR